MGGALPFFSVGIYKLLKMLLLNTRRALAPAVVPRLPYLHVQNILQSFAQDTSPSL